MNKLFFKNYNRKRERPESKFQKKIVKEFNLLFAKEINERNALIFDVPNGSLRHIAVAKQLKEEGVLPGVSDLIVSFYGKVFFVEVKAPAEFAISEKTGKKIISKSGGRQSEPQKDFQKTVEHQGHTYLTVDSEEKKNKFFAHLKNLDRF